MQSVHEILAGLTPDDYPNLTRLVAATRKRKSGPAQVIVLDEATRSHALLMRRQRELNNRLAFKFEFDTAC